MQDKTEECKRINEIKKTHYNPYTYVEELLDYKLLLCVNEIIQWNKTALLIDGEVRQLCKKIAENVKVNEDIILTYLKTAIFEEAAKRWEKLYMMFHKK